jgi:internalin A
MLQICHWKRKEGEPCIHYYNYEELVRRIEAKRYKVECPQTFMDVSAPTLLYGIHTSTDESVIADIQRGQQRIEKRLDSLRKLVVKPGGKTSNSPSLSRKR